MRLYEGKAGGFYAVEEISREKLGEEWTKRMKALGLMKGAVLLLLNKKKSGAAAVKVRGTRLALGRKLAESIEICPLEEKKSELKERGRRTVG